MKNQSSQPTLETASSFANQIHSAADKMDTTQNIHTWWESLPDKDKERVMLEEVEREVAEINLVRGVRKLTKIGTGPCGGGGMLGEYHQGVRSAERRVRDECRKLLKDYKNPQPPAKP